MEVMKHLRAEADKKKEMFHHFKEEVEKKKEVLHNFKEDVEEVVEDALLRRRRSTNVPASPTSTGTGEVAVDLDTSNKMEGCVINVEGDEKEEKSEEIVYFDKSEGTGREWSHFNVKVEDLGAKLKDVDAKQVLTSLVHGKVVDHLKSKVATLKDVDTNQVLTSLIECKEVDHLKSKVTELKDVDAKQVLTSLIKSKEVDHVKSKVDHLKSKILPGSNLPTSTKPQPQEAPEHAEADEEFEESDEEVIELEFERAVEKIHTHDDYTMYCPNCSNRITKVVLRRKIRQRRAQIQADTQRGDLLGCLSCFSIFIPSGNRLNPFRIFGARKGPESTPLLQQEQQTPDASMPISGTTQDKGKGFDLFGIFGKRRPYEPLPAADINSSSPKATNQPRDQASDQGEGFMTFIPNAIPPQGINGSKLLAGDGVMTFIPNAPPPLGMTGGNGVATVDSVGNNIQTSNPSQGSMLNIGVYAKTDVRIRQPESEINGQKDTLNQPGGDDVRIQVDKTPVLPHYSPVVDVLLTDARLPEAITEPQSPRSLEIVKSVVYGGLMESIASLSVVSSAAASDATTLNIVALGLANLVGGLVVLAHNLKDLRYGDSNETSETIENRYKEHLGRKEHFVLHATIAVLSYLVFGLIPPVIYGFTFRESDDRDYKLLAVAVASLLGIIILAIAKAYVRGEHRFMSYFKTIMYYVTSAVMVSGVAFAVGELVNKVLESLGWFTPAIVEPRLFPQTQSSNPTSWASF